MVSATTPAVKESCAAGAGLDKKGRLSKPQIGRPAGSLQLTGMSKTGKVGLSAWRVGAAAEL